MVDIPRPTLRHGNNILNKVLTAWNKPSKNISCFIIIWNYSKTKYKNQNNGFLQLDSIALENFDEEHEQTSDQKLHKRKYWFICLKNIRN